MIYLILQIFFSSAFTIIIKWAQMRGKEDVVAIGAINYIVAALAVVPFVLMADFSTAPDSMESTAAIANSAAVDSMDASSNQDTSAEASDANSPMFGAILTGGAMGGVYFIAFFFAIYAIKTVGASTASVVSVLSILMPIIVASVFWGQHPNTLQAVGIGLALLALSLIGAQKKPKPSAGIIASNSPDETQTLDEAETSNQPSDETAPRAWVIPVVLVLFFLLCGCSRIFQEAFKFVSEPQYKPIFSLAAFTVAGIPSLIFLISKKRWPMPMELVLGTFLGISNILQVHFILLAFDYFAGFIVFPMSSAGGVLLTTAAATGLLGERLTRRTCVGIAISVVALFLLHWLPS